jgi:hypothetical protein
MNPSPTSCHRAVPTSGQSRRTATRHAVLATALGLLSLGAAPLAATERTAADAPPTRAPEFVRYWTTPFAAGDLTGAYVSVTVRDGVLEFWRGAPLNDLGDDDQSRKVEALVVRRGQSLETLGKPEVALVMRDLIDDVPRPDGGPGPAPGRAFTRTWITYEPEAGYVGLVCAHPEYRGHYLHPALIVSPTGRPGTWRYLGKLKGEPAAETQRRRVWSDGGSIFRLDDGRWRIYLNGYGENPSAVVALEADRLDGEWTFLKDDAGRIRQLTPTIPSAGGQSVGPFPTVLRVSPTEWHLWTSDRWPPDAIWHFHSTDGLRWQLYGRQPEIIRRDREDNIKCLRAFLAPDGTTIVGLLSVMSRPTFEDDGRWNTHWSTLPAGPPPGP